MKKVLIYYPFPLRDQKSGSAVRPFKMMQAFDQLAENKDIEVIKIYGTSYERKKQLNEIYINISPKNILFCYMENSTMPFWLTDKDHLPRTPFLEWNFFRYLKKHDIPLGIFYRDIYWMFDDEYPLKGYKKVIMRKIYRLEHLLYKKYASQFFLPSTEMNKYARFPKEKTTNLPPAGNNLVRDNSDHSNEIDLIYVGGINERYGLKILLQSVYEYSQKQKINLHLVCRKQEYYEHINVFNAYQNNEWLNIYHAFGKDLEKIYAKANVAITPILKNMYNDFAVPVKLFEYMSYGLPQIITNCEAQSEIINKDSLGKVVEDNRFGILNGLEFFSNEETRRRYAEKVANTLQNKHLWEHRAEKVYRVLVEGD